MDVAARMNRLLPDRKRSRVMNDDVPSRVVDLEAQPNHLQTKRNVGADWKANPPPGHHAVGVGVSVNPLHASRQHCG